LAALAAGRLPAALLVLLLLPPLLLLSLAFLPPLGEAQGLPGACLLLLLLLLLLPLPPDAFFPAAQTTAAAQQHDARYVLQACVIAGASRGRLPLCRCHPAAAVPRVSGSMLMPSSGY
jgi:hypothetical protein